MTTTMIVYDKDDSDDDDDDDDDDDGIDDDYGHVDDGAILCVCFRAQKVRYRTGS